MDSSIKVGELFIELGIKGQEKTVGALVSVEKGLGGLASMSLEAKAAILGAMYAVEQLFSKSGHQGTNLTNFNALLGVSTKTIQQYEYAARQMGVSNEETEASFKGLQATMSKTALGQGAPKGFGQVAMLTGGITAADVNKFMANPELLLQKLQDYAQKEKRVGVRNEALKSFGLGDSMISALSRGAFKPSVLSKAPVYGDGEVKALDRANIAWANLGNTIQMAIGHLNAAHGGQIVKDFGILVNMGLKLADIILTVVERFHLFEKADKLFGMAEKGANNLFSSLAKIGAFLSDFSGKNKFFEDIEGHFETLKTGAESIAHYLTTMASKIMEVGKSSHFIEHIGKIFGESIEVVSKFARTFDTLETSIVKVAEKFHVFESIAKVIDAFLTGIEMALKGIGAVLDLMNGGKPAEKVASDVETSLKDKKTQDILKFIGGYHNDSAGVFSGLLDKITGSKPEDKVPAAATEPVTKVPGADQNSKGTPGEPVEVRVAPGKTELRLVTPPAPALQQVQGWMPPAPKTAEPASQQTIQNVNVDQTLNFQSQGTEAKDTAHAVKKAVSGAFRQLSSQNQGS